MVFPDGCLQSEICERLSATKQAVSSIVKKFLKLGYLSLSEAGNDRRNKIVRLTDRGVQYTEQIIPPAANAEIAAMGEMPDKDIAELVHLTTIFSNCMREKFDKIGEE